MVFSFLNLEYIGLSVVAVLLLKLFEGHVRQGIFFLVNVTYLWVFLLGPLGTFVTVVFCGLGYILAKVICHRPIKPVFILSLVGTILLFVYMQDYDFLYWLLPESLLTRTLRTIGLSFLFFKMIHVLIEARSGTLGAFNLPTYLNYCLNFTTFMMGPIQRYQDYFSQWNKLKPALSPDFEAHLNAVLRILFGLIKAYVLATWLEGTALRPDTHLFSLSLLELVIQVYAFYFYLYLNFSGYCDVAIGVGSLLGIRPPENFNFPFLARNVSDFWLRQHRSLTLWLTDYVFSPLYKKMMTHSWWGIHPLLAANGALIVTMLISGLWHGTTINFFLFGLAHGIFLVIYRTWDTALIKLLGKTKVRALREHWIIQLGGMVLTFNATAFAFIFFRLHPIL